MLDVLNSHGQLLNAIGVNALLSLGMWITLAHNQEAFAQVGFMALGAYTSVLLTVWVGAPFPVALLGGALIPALIAALVGVVVLRLRGIFLAIATVAFGEVVRGILLNVDAVGGSLGIDSIPVKTTAWKEALAIAAVLYGLWRLGISRTGRALRALRDDEHAAASNGIAVWRTKTLVFCLGAAIVGLAGAFSAHYMNFIDPNQYVFSKLIEIVSFVVVGGLVSPWGAVLGAVVLTWLTELLRWTQTFHVLANGAILLAIVLFFPAGLLGIVHALGARLPPAWKWHPWSRQATGGRDHACD